MERMYMNPATGSVDTYEGWWYDELDEEGYETGNRVNAVDRSEVLEVVKATTDDPKNNIKSGDWITREYFEYLNRSQAIRQEGIKYVEAVERIEPKQVGSDYWHENIVFEASIIEEDGTRLKVVYRVPQTVFVRSDGELVVNFREIPWVKYTDYYMWDDDDVQTGKEKSNAR